MRDFKTFLVEYNTQRHCQSALPYLLAKILLAAKTLQVLSFLCISSNSHGDLIAKSVQNVVSLFNLPYFCKKIGVTLTLPLSILLILHLVHILMTIVSIFVQLKYKKLQDWVLSAVCKIEHYTLNREVVFLFSLATGMEAIFQPRNFAPNSNPVSSTGLKATEGLGITLAVMSVLHFYWQIYVHIPISYSAELSTTEPRNDVSRILKGIILTLVSVFAYTQTPLAVYVCVGIYLLIELISIILLGSYSNLRMNYISLWVCILQIPLYFILLVGLWSNPDALANGKSSQRSIGVLLLAPFIGGVFLNMERRRLNFTSKQASQCLIDKIQGLSWLQVSQIDFFLKQICFKFMNLREHTSEVYQILEIIIQTKNSEDPTFLYQVQNNLMQNIFETDPSEYLLKPALKVSFYEVINSIYSSMLSQERKMSKSTSIECYLSYIAFHKDITGNYGKAFIILARLQKILATSTSSRAAACVELIERELQKQVAGSESQKTISAEMLFSFLDRSEGAQLSIEKYISDAVSFYEMLQAPIISTREIRSKGKKLLDQRVTILEDLDSLIKINEYHQHTLLVYEFFLSDIVEEKAQGQFFQIKNRIDIFHAVECYNQYCQTTFNNNNTTDPEKLGWDMSIEFFANQLDDSSDYSVVVFSINPEHVGRIVRCSTNLCDLLEIDTKDMNQMNISNIEATLFSAKSLKNLQERILKGEASLRDLSESERTLYLRLKSGNLIAYSFVADVEIYGKDPCITCYLRKKKSHEQEFMIFSMKKQDEAKLVGISEALLNDIMKSKDSFKEVLAGNLKMVDMIPSLKSILPSAQTNPVWSEEDALLLIPSMPRLSIPKRSYLLNYSGKIQTVSMTGQKFGIINVRYFVPISVPNKEQNGCNLAASPILKKAINSHTDFTHPEMQNNELKNLIDLQGSRQDFDDEEDTNEHQTQKNTPLAKLPELSKKIQAENSYFQGENGSERRARLKLELSPKSQLLPRNNEMQNNVNDPRFVSQENKNEVTKMRSPLQNHDSNNERGSSLASDHVSFDKVEAMRNNRHKYQIREKAGGSNKITNGRASSVGSSIGAHLGYIRSLILGKQTPAVLNAVNIFGTIVLVSTVVSIFVAYFVLSNRYSIFTLFAQSASFSSYIRCTAYGLMSAGELQVAAQFFPSVLQVYWEGMAGYNGLEAYKQFTREYNEFVLDFDLPFLLNNITDYSIYAEFPDLSEINRNLSFYEANEVFSAYTYKFSQYNYFSGAMDPSLLNFSRTFTLSFDQMYKTISEQNFENIYSLYYSSITILDAIMAIGIILSILLILVFLPIYWKYQKMEMIAFTKLCNVSISEFETSIKKITDSYWQLFEKNLPALENFQENVKNSKKSSKNSRILSSVNGDAQLIGLKRNRVGKKLITDKNSNIVLVLLTMFISLLLSVTYIAINLTFKNSTSKILPYLTDLDQMSTGLPSYPTILAILMRLFNEVSNPNINQTLPILLQTYQGMLDESVASQKEMSDYLINSLQRAQESGVLSNSTKELYTNLTNNNFCWNITADGYNLYSYCISSLNGVASTGFFAASDNVLELMTQQITVFTNSPTLATMESFYYASDALDLLIMAYSLQAYMLQLSQAEQTDVGNYTQQLLSQTHIMLAWGMLYNIGLLFLIWVPTITYLRKRFKLARSVFLLLPTKILQMNGGIRNLFKAW